MSELQKITPNVSVNSERRLYVIEFTEGYSCLGFDTVTDRTERYNAWLKRYGSEVDVACAPAGTSRHWQDYDQVVKAVLEACKKFRVRCDADLEPQLIGLEGKRVEVVDKDGEVRRFQVGKSTGPIPCHLELERRNSNGGGPVYGAPFSFVQVIL